MVRTRRAMLREKAPSRGAAAVEFALVVPILCVLLFGIIAFGVMLSFRQNLSQAAAEGSRATIGAWSATTCPSIGTTGCLVSTSARAAIKSSLASQGIDCDSGYLTCTVALIDSKTTTAPGCALGHICASVTVSYPYDAHPKVPNFPGLGLVMPSTLSFTSVVQLS
ncbi:TadE/TadG family type IV pilus assembly protein [Nocardioides sp. Kera G14]|uniref:TadE/TadG family type IV pilus assembly protein n=1 Tax=Nocardioides sp. Kera G14 TaxID=2884264 RepID=UPI001D11ADF3|nr:TadE/TadG family type IV pilus assembly protein [Nocardioides sp. Kera G14]UDY22641.1 pilus assembly protein [Nocardioides sp. Kera G14]